MKLFNPKQYLAIDIANNADKDKLLFEDRIQWVKDNYNNLEDLEPNNNKLKFLFRKSVKALRDVDKGKPTGHLISLDSVNSGVQVLAAICKCRDTALTCGLVNTGKRPDVYTEVLGNNKTITRNQIKEALIPLLYGSKAKPEELFGEGTPELDAFYQTVHEKIPALEAFTDVVKYIWNSNARYHQFTMPDGHTVKLPTIVNKKLRVRAEHTLGFSYYLEYRDIEPSTNYIPLLSGIVHSVDAYLCREVIRKLAKQQIEVSTIHDAYFVSPLYGNELRWAYIETLAEITKGNLLSDIINEITGKKIPVNLPDNKLYKEVYHSEYALS